MLKHTKRQVKVFFFFPRNVFIFPYVYHRSLFFVSSQAKMAKKQKYLWSRIVQKVKKDMLCS